MTSPASFSGEVPQQVGLGIEELVAAAERLGLKWRLRPGTVVRYTGSATDTPVYLDGDEGVETRAQSLIGTLTAFDRVMVMFVPPQGIYVIGRPGNGNPAPNTQVKYKTADETVTTDSIQSDNHIFFDIVKGSYLLDGTVFYSCTTVADMKQQFGWNSTRTSGTWGLQALAAAGGGTPDGDVTAPAFSFPGIANAFLTSGGAGSNVLMTTIRGYFECTSSDGDRIGWAWAKRNVDGVTPLTVYKGTWFTLTKVA